MPKNEQLKLAVEEIKVKHHINQAAIAERLGINPTYFSGLINGKYPLTSNIVNQLSELFQVQVYKDGESELLQMEEARFPDMDEKLLEGSDADVIKNVLIDFFRRGELYSRETYFEQSNYYQGLLKSKEEELTKKDVEIGQLKAVIEMLKGKTPEEILEIINKRNS